MSKNWYRERLRQSEWRRKRYNILVRDNHTCQICGYIGARVNVHHKSYNGDPWGVDDDQLITLCYGCHYKTHRPELYYNKATNISVGNIIRKEYYG